MSDERVWSVLPFFPPVSNAELAACESEVGVNLPDDYREFLLLYNGGYPTPQQLDIPHTEHSVLLDVLYGIGKRAVASDLAYELRSHRRDLPEGFLPIGHDPGGSPFLLATIGDERGKLFFWDRTWFFKESSATGNTYWLADNFTTFMKSLYDEP